MHRPATKLSGHGVWHKERSSPHSPCMACRELHALKLSPAMWNFCQAFFLQSGQTDCAWVGLEWRELSLASHEVVAAVQCGSCVCARVGAWNDGRKQQGCLV